MDTCGAVEVKGEGVWAPLLLAGPPGEGNVPGELFTGVTVGPLRYAGRWLALGG